MHGTSRAKIDNGATLSNEKDLTNSKTYLANRVSVSPIDFGAVSNNADIDHTEIILRVIKFAEKIIKLLIWEVGHGGLLVH